MPRTKSQFRKGRTPGKTSAPIRRDLDTLIQGVSQQPPHLRQAGQGARQVNGWSSPVEGLTKRNATRLQSRISDGPLTDFYLEMMSISQEEQYSVFCRPGETSQTLIDLRRNGTIPTVDVHGTGLTVANGVIEAAADSYVYNEPGALYKDYVLINSGPLGLLLNRNVPTAFNPDVVEPTVGQGIVFIQAVAYDVTYEVRIGNKVVATHTTPRADADNNKISTSAVAKDLKDQIASETGYSASVRQYVIKVVKTDGTEFELEIDDGRSGELATAFNDKVSDLSKLPTIAPNNYRVEVESDPAIASDNRWFKFSTFKGSFGPGAWEEAVAPSITYELNVNTMPLVLYRAEKDVFFVGPADGATRTQTVDGKDYEYTFPKWGDRTAGNELTSPDPEFVGYPNQRSFDIPQPLCSRCRGIDSTQ